MLLVLSAAFAQAPDYDSPYAPITTDKSVYSWTDKVQMRIIAPSWNTNAHLIDSIGGTDTHSIKISTRQHSLEPYRFAETSPNSGIFAAEVILTGFLHDVDGDRKFDTVPRTIGNGPTNGFLEADRNSSVTISFEFADGIIITESIPIIWNVGTIDFHEKPRMSDNRAQVRVYDPDLNLNPETRDQIKIHVSSDSDVAGILLEAIETGDSSGLFVGDLHFTQNHTTSGSRLYAVPGDTIHAKYDDYTLPEPYSESDRLAVKATAILDPDMPLDRITYSDIVFSDSLGNPLDAFSTTTQIQIIGVLTNEQNFPQPFVHLIQIKDESGYVVSLFWLRGAIGAHQSLDVSQSWMPQKSGTYAVETFAWDSIAGMSPLSPPLSTSLLVG